MMTHHKNDAIIFANGPYQLLVGLSCAQQEIINLSKVYVFLYDMKWKENLKFTCLEFSQALGLINVSFPFEFQKSDVTNKHTHPIRSVINHLTFFFYGIFNSIPYVFIPKLYGSPERAIILASLRKKIYIYDDGFGMYLNPVINQNNIDIRLYTFIDRYFSKQKGNILICPRKPNLMDYSDFHGIQISNADYSNKLRNNFQVIANHFSEFLWQHLEFLKAKKRIILIALPRLAFTDQQQIAKEIRELITELVKTNKDLYFLLKPHPRDLPDDLTVLTQILDSAGPWDYLPDYFSSFPMEILSSILNSELIISGYSTVGVNGDLLSNSRVMVFDFLSFNIFHYNKYAQGIMKKAGTYSGTTVRDAITKIKVILNGVK